MCRVLELTYADDTTFVTGGRMELDQALVHMQEILDAAQPWGLLLGLRINLSKTECLLISGGRIHVCGVAQKRLQSSGEGIPAVCDFRFLGWGPSSLSSSLRFGRAFGALGLSYGELGNFSTLIT